jgi:probable H4MPT-linked C1 transfer pathway protein
MSSESTIGWDLGGAHLKAARLDSQGRVMQVVQLPCPLWQGLTFLKAGIDSALQQLSSPRARHALTMTGELADLFEDRREGVRSLLDTFSTSISAEQISIYAGEAGFVTVDQHDAFCEQIASANWRATAEFLASRLPEALLVDVGSTTTDIVPIKQSVLACGHDDRERLVHEELLYTGVVRSSLMSVVDRIPFNGEWVPVMAEHFATTADVYRLTDELPEDADQMPSADGKGKSPLESARRLARMLGCDVHLAPFAAWRRCAGYVAEVQLTRIFNACQRVLSRGILNDDAPLIGAGVGRFLVMKLAQRMQRPYLDFSTCIDSSDCASRWSAYCAPAVAVAALLQARGTSIAATAILAREKTSCG